MRPSGHRPYPGTSGRPATPRAPAKKRFGQHFLEGPWVAKVIAAIDPRSDDFFIEIGPGRGAMTLPLAARAAHVIACELDRDMADALEAAHHPTVTILRGDFVAMTAEGLSQAIAAVSVPFARLRVVGNLPYNVGTVMLSTVSSFRRAGLPIVDATVMLQREVADRLVAQPGTRDYGALTVLVGQWASPERLLAVPPGAFRPAPSVQSAVVRLTYRQMAGPGPSDPPPPQAQPVPRHQAHFEALVKALFDKRRKTLSNALRGARSSGPVDTAAVLEDAGIDGRRRPETLSLAELVRLADLTSP
jgi:16S rRNA (adenine1518-N6/adenine1519-N6)-dimethyltransferase